MPNSEQFDPDSIGKLVEEAYRRKEARQAGAPQQQPQQPELRKPAEQPGRIGRLTDEHFQGLEGLLPGQEERYRLKGKELDTALQEARAKKGSHLTPQEIAEISGRIGINLGSYLFCGISSPLNGSNTLGVFWNGDEQAPLPAKYVPLQWLETLLGAENNIDICPNHQVLSAINAKHKDKGRGKYTSHEALVIEPWRKFQSPEQANVRLKELGLAEVELLTYTERTLRKGKLVGREMQALIFPAEKYAEHEKRQALARLRGEQPREIVQQTRQPQYSTQPVAQQEAPKQLLPPSEIEELLPKGKLKEMSLTVLVDYEGEKYEFALPVLLNEFMAIDGEKGYRLEGKSGITFTDEAYISDEAARKVNYASAEAARRGVELMLIAKDRRLRTRLSPDMQKNVESALQQHSPTAKQNVIITLSNLLKEQDQKRQ